MKVIEYLATMYALNKTTAWGDNVFLITKKDMEEYNKMIDVTEPEKTYRKIWKKFAKDYKGFYIYESTFKKTGEEFIYYYTLYLQKGV